MSENIKFTIDIPRNIVHNKSEEMKYNDNGAAFAWLDLSSIIKTEGYGVWFPNWLINERLEYCTLTIKRVYISGYTEKEVQNKFIIEHKEKIKGRRFKRFTYSPEELIELLSVYSDKIIKAKTAEQTQVLAKVTEQIRRNESVMFYAIGYINGKMFHSKDVERFRYVHNLKNRQGAKQLSAKSCEIIAENLTETDIADIRRIIKAKEIAEQELRELDRSLELPYPFKKILGNELFETDNSNEYLTELFMPHSLISETRLTVKGYPERLRNVLDAIKTARSFLQETIEKAEYRLSNYNTHKERR